MHRFAVGRRLKFSGFFVALGVVVLKLHQVQTSIINHNTKRKRDNTKMEGVGGYFILIKCLLVVLWIVGHGRKNVTCVSTW